jgi:3,4-dihydroxy 2-butanone 4-phosphate synthase / GTP cyclohydrolase II
MCAWCMATEPGVSLLRPIGTRMAVPAALREALAAGGLGVVWTVHEGRGRGVLVADARRAEPALVNAMLRAGRGLTAFSVPPPRAMAMGLEPAGEARVAGRPTLALRTVEAAACEGTGISAADRAMTLRAAGAAAGPGLLKSPGHVVPHLVVDPASGAPAAAALAVLQAAAGAEVPAWTDILDDAGELASLAWCAGLGFPLMERAGD